MAVEVGSRVEEFGHTVRLWMNARLGEVVGQAGLNRWCVRYDDGTVKDAQETCLAVAQCSSGADAKDTRKRYLRFLWPDGSPSGSESPAVLPHEVSIRYPQDHAGPWLLTEELASRLSDYLPASLSFQRWSCTFSPRLHGVSLPTLYRRFERSPSASIFLVRDAGGRIFGGFASEAWRNAGRYYGNGECFVFSVGEKAGKHGLDLHVYNWSGGKRFYMYSDASTLAMGEGGRSAISITGDFLCGSSLPCDIFSSPVLSSEPDFVIEAIEFWGFECPGEEEL